MPVPLQTAVVGIGGFATSHHRHLNELEQIGAVRVVATCDPRADDLLSLQANLHFRERGIGVFPTFEAMLETIGTQLQLVTIPAPVRFHAPYHRACVERGIACYLEKPPTLDPEELEKMIATDIAAKYATQVGFNYIYLPYRLELKRRLVAGEFGRVRRVSFLGLSRRPDTYYRRNPWAGRLLLDDYILLDSCCGNAMSHQLHNILFWADTREVMSWSRPAMVEAELYRANPIESADTVFARGQLENGVEFRIAASHACAERQIIEEVIECENARIKIDPAQNELHICHSGGGKETMATEPRSLTDNLRLYCEYISGRQDRPMTRLSDCRGFVQLNALLYVAARYIHSILPPNAVLKHAREENTQAWEISEIAASARTMILDGTFPSKQGLSWASPGKAAKNSDLPRLRNILPGIIPGSAWLS